MRYWRIEPANAEAAYNLGLALKQQDDFAGAETELRKAARLDPTLPEAPFTLGVVLWQTGRPDEALEQFRETLARKADYADAFYMIGTISSSRARSPKPSCSSKKQSSIVRCPPRPTCSLGQALSQLGDKEAGATELARSRPPQSQNGRRAGIDVRGQRRRAEGQEPATIAAAIEQFREAIRLADDNPQAHYQLALALRHTGARAEAQTHFETAHRLAPYLESAGQTTTDDSGTLHRVLAAIEDA